MQFKTNIHCGNCLRSVTPFLNEIHDMPAWSVDLTHPDRVLTVDSEDSELAKAVCAAIEEAGFEVMSNE